MVAAAALALILLCPAGLIAQSGPAGPATGPQQFTMTVTSNVPGSEVHLDGIAAGKTGGGAEGGPLRLRATAGLHNIRVSAPGFADWSRRIDLGSDLTIDAQLARAAGPDAYSVMVTASVDGAAVTVDGYRLISGAPVRVTVPAGTHEFRVSLQGYNDWSRRVDVGSDTTLRADLVPAQYNLKVVSNVDGAEVTLSSVETQGPPFRDVTTGTVPFDTRLGSGTYLITVTAGGYLPFTTTVTLRADQTVTATLLPSQATVELVLPERFRNPYDRNYLSRIEWYVDGERVSGSSGAAIRVTAGSHEIRIVSGGLSITGRFVLQAGRVYRLEPTLGLRLVQ